MRNPLSGWPASLALLVAAFVAGLTPTPTTAWAQEPVLPGQQVWQPTYAQALALLREKTEIIELVDGELRVAVAPQWQGRVLTATNEGLDGPSFGWLNRDAIQSDVPNRQFNNYGGGDRFWLGPEAGPYSLYFDPGREQTLPNWRVPPGLNAGAFREMPRTFGEGERSVRLVRRLKVPNATGNELTLDVERIVRLLDNEDFEGYFGEDAAMAALATPLVGYEARHTVYNRGPLLDDERGLISIWSLGQFPAGDRTVVIVPYLNNEKLAAAEKKPVDQVDGGPVVTSTEYFGDIPPERLKITPNAVLFRADGKFRSKIGIGPRRVMPLAGAIDFDRGVLTLMQFQLPEKPAKARYLNNAWTQGEDETLLGDVFNAYNDGPAGEAPARPGQFFELESLSPAPDLKPNAAIKHGQRIWHLTGTPEQLKDVAEAVLGVPLDNVERDLGL